MRKVIIFTSLSILTMSSFGCNKETIIDSSSLPESSRTFITQHFADQTILQVKKDRDGFKMDYEVLLSQSTSLEFFKNGGIKEINTPVSIPDAALPSKIVDYAQTNYGNNFIVKWSLEKKKQEVKLDNGIELEFDTDGNFKQLDN